MVADPVIAIIRVKLNCCSSKQFKIYGFTLLTRSVKSVNFISYKSSFVLKESTDSYRLKVDPNLIVSIIYCEL